MRRGWKSRAVLLICACLAGGAVSPLAPPASLGGPRAAVAQEAPPAVRAAAAVEAEMTAARKLMTDGKWKDAEAAWKAVLASRPNDPTVSMRLTEIEDGLRTAMFRAQWKGVDMKAELGPATLKFNPGTRIAEFDTRPGEAGEGWTVTGRVAVFDRPFENEVAVEFGWVMRIGDEVRPPPAMLVAYDTEKRGGYALSVAPPRDTSYTWGHFEGRIQRITGDESTAIGKGDGVTFDWEKVKHTDVRYERGASTLFVKVGGKEVARANDTKFRSGSIAVVTGTGDLPNSIRVVGKLSEAYARRIAAEAENTARRAWEVRSWNRGTVLPAWITNAERRSEAALEALPPPEDPTKIAVRARAACGVMLRAFYEGNRSAALLDTATWNALDGRTRRYVTAVDRLRRQEWQKAVPEFLALSKELPDFAPALTGLAWAQFEVHDREAAQASLAASIVLDPGFAASHELAARIALADGDVTAARAALAFAASKGVMTPGLQGLAEALLRLERGPSWPKRFEHPTANFDIASDHSAATCVEVGKQLEDARAAYQAKFRAVPPNGRRSKVYVFSGEQSYLDYASDFGSDVRNSLGVYMPITRHLAVFLHDDRVELWNTVRHEGFHQYLHQIADDVPLWFNEGYAEFFGFSRRKFGKTVTGQADEGQRGAVALLREHFEPLDELFCMERSEFMRKPEVRYVQSWSVIHFLRETKDPALKGVLDRYLDALVAGKGRIAAFDEVLKPVLPTIDSGWKAHISALSR